VDKGIFSLERIGERNPKIGIALGSGGARGMAHIGVLRALEEAGVKPELVAGTSIGALVGGIYSAGKINELTEIALGLDWKKAARYFMEVSFPRSGLIEGARINEFLLEMVGDRSIEDLPRAFSAVATDIMSGREEVLCSGGLVDAIRASISVPGIFTPAKVNDAFLVDGGLVNPVPVNVCRKMGAEFVIAVDINNGRTVSEQHDTLPAGKENQKRRLIAGVDTSEMFAWLERRTAGFDASFLEPVKQWMTRDPVPGIFDVLGSSLRIMEEQITETRLRIDPPDLLIRPAVAHIGFMEFFLAGEMISEGCRAAKEALGRLKV